jgi:hypothetical protein
MRAWAIRKTRYRLGFHLGVAPTNPMVNEAIRQNFGLAGLNPMSTGFLSSRLGSHGLMKPWFIEGCHRKQYVPRRLDEEHDPTCIIETH